VIFARGAAMQVTGRPLLRSRERVSVLRVGCRYWVFHGGRWRRPGSLTGRVLRTRGRRFFIIVKPGCPVRALAPTSNSDRSTPRRSRGKRRHAAAIMARRDARTMENAAASAPPIRYARQHAHAPLARRACAGRTEPRGT